MHNLHFILVNAESAVNAANTVSINIENWGCKDNRRKICGVVSQDGEDIIENYEGGRYPIYILSEGISETNFFKAGLIQLHDYKKRFLENNKNFLRDLSSRTEIEYEDISTLSKLYELQFDEIQFQSNKFDEFGLTDQRLTEPKENEKSYLVMIDMHS